MTNDPEVILHRIDRHLRDAKRAALDANDFRTVHAVLASLRTVNDLVRVAKLEQRKAA